MPINPPCKHAAQYVRMSTDQQQYSTANQKAAISAWAEAHDIEIVATYEDAGRSGLTLAGRPALRKLIADVLAGPRLFETILVYDVSRWGRFQDTDESAHLEFLCRSAGVSVHYCAEPFENDGTPLANLCKVLKRALAAEYSRELSEKVAIGKARLASMGYHQGSDPGYGFQRRLIDRNGVDKGPLGPGELKSILTDRVILAPGLPEEVATVRWIFETYANARLSMPGIARTLNRDGVPRNNRVWCARSVRTVLSCPKYVGDYYWGMTSFRLSSQRRAVPKDAWVVCRDAFAPIIARELFQRVQDRRASRYQRRTDQELIQRLSAILQKEGSLSRLIMDKHRLNHHVYINRFGSLGATYALCGADPIARPRNEPMYQARLAARIAMRDYLRTLIDAKGGTFVWDARFNQAIVNGELVLKLNVIPPPMFRHSDDRGWQLAVSRSLSSVQDLTLIGVLGNDLQPSAYYLLPPNEARLNISLRAQNEEVIDSFRLTNLDAVLQIVRRQNSEKPKDNRRPTENRFAISPMSKQLLMQKRSWQKRHRNRVGPPRSILHFCVRHLCRKRDSVDKAARAVQLRTKLQHSIREVLAHTPTFQRLRSAGLQTVPSAIYSATTASSGETERVEDKTLGPLLESGLCASVAALLEERVISYGAIGCLKRMSNQRQLEVATAMIAEQRFTCELARVLLALTPNDNLVDPCRPSKIPGGQRMRKLLLQEDGLTRSLASEAVRAYPIETYNIQVLVAFGRKLVDTKFGVSRTRRVRDLREILAEVSAWHSLRSGTRLSRGRPTNRSARTSTSIETPS